MGDVEGSGEDILQTESDREGSDSVRISEYVHEGLSELCVRTFSPSLYIIITF